MPKFGPWFFALIIPAVIFSGISKGGVVAHVRHTIPQRGFFAVTYVALTLTGAKLIWDGLA